MIDPVTGPWVQATLESEPPYLPMGIRTRIHHSPGVRLWAEVQVHNRQSGWTTGLLSEESSAHMLRKPAPGDDAWPLVSSSALRDYAFHFLKLVMERIAELSLLERQIMTGGIDE